MTTDGDRGCQSFACVTFGSDVKCIFYLFIFFLEVEVVKSTWRRRFR